MVNETGPKDVEDMKRKGSTPYKDGLADTLIQPNPELFGNRDAILRFLKENSEYIRIEENVNYMGFKGKKVHITLPKVEGKFEGFKFEYFVSDCCVINNYFKKKPELEKKSYSMKDVGGLLGAMNKYMQAMGVETDGDVDYENELKSWETDNYRSGAGDCLKAITGLDREYWLKDRDIDCLDWTEGSRARWRCINDSCCFHHIFYPNSYAYLFLRLSD